VKPQPAVGGGAHVVRVAANGTAQRAGVAVDDVLVGIDDHVIASVGDLVAHVRDVREGAIMRLIVKRDGELVELTATAEPLPTESAVVSLDHVMGSDDARLRTIYTTPDGPGPHPAVFYLQSSDWSSCEHPLSPRHPVRRLIAGFTETGFATLRVERSGVGDSEGRPCAEVDFEDELTGYRAGLAQLRKRHDVVFLFGNSLGGMVAPLIADDDLAGVVVIGTSAATWHECLLGSFRRQAERAEREQSGVDADIALLAELQELVLRQKRTPEAVYADHPHLRDAGFTHYAGKQSYGRSVTFFQQLEATDLRAAWARVHVPVLAVHGEADWICTPDDARRIAELVGARAETRELAGVDHGLAEPDAVTAVVGAATEWMSAMARS
jgi:pimeloyl-ACP methyl ester carboxylesterase